MPFETPADRKMNLASETSRRCVWEHIIINLKNIFKPRFTSWPHGNIPELKHSEKIFGINTDSKLKWPSSYF